MEWEIIITVHAIGIAIIAGALGTWRARLRGKIITTQQSVLSLKRIIFKRSLELKIARAQWEHAAAEWTRLKKSQEFFKGHALAGVKSVALLACEIITCEKRAKLHCEMIEDNRRRAYMIWKKLQRAEVALTDALDHRVTWSTCPVCGRLVACTGWPWPVGTCRHCDRIITDSEICQADPIAQEHELIEWNLYTSAHELRDALTRAPSRDLAQAELKAAIKQMGEAIDAADRAFPDIGTPPAFRPENKEVAHMLPRYPRSLGDKRPVELAYLAFCKRVYQTIAAGAGIPLAMIENVRFKRRDTPDPAFDPARNAAEVK